MNYIWALSDNMSYFLSCEGLAFGNFFWLFISKFYVK